jgi:hypothetical protein
MRNRLLDVRRALVAGVIATAAVVAGCNVTDQLLSAPDPDFVPPGATDSPDGADALRLGAMARFRNITAGDNGNGNESTWLFGGLLADEWGTASTFVQNDQVDERRVGADNSTVTYAFRKLHRVRTAVNQALAMMRKYRETNLTDSTRIAELYLARAFAEMQLASDFCNGIPLSNGTSPDGVLRPEDYGDPLTVDSVFKIAIITADSGMLYAVNTDTQTVNILNALKVTKARALLGINQIAAAGALVAPIPTTFSYNHTFSSTTGSNAIWGQPFSGRRYLVGDSIEGNARNILVRNAIPFFSAKDPRLPATFTIVVRSGKPDTTKSQDGLTLSRTTNIYGQFTTVTVASGLDARLIEAEAQLAAGNVTGANGMIPILNALRAQRFQIGTLLTPTMPALSDPGTPSARLDLLFREKAFWTFSRGQRLGDMRRLIRQYGRAANTVFPEGQHYRGTTYGVDVNLPVPQEELNNPKFKGCIDRNA